jgi:signal transduction histidine kinase/putative methionine-R-sulfoxide reductase with GAF domain
MGRRTKPAKVKTEAKRPLARKAPKKEAARVHDLEKRLAESLEREKATSEILRVISGSLTDTQPVFDAIAANAAQLCAARDAQVLQVEGDVLRLVSAYGSPSMPPVRSISRGHAVGRAVIDRQTIHVRDMAQAVAEFPETSAPLHGVQSVLAVPLLRKDVAIGVIRISRTQIQPFTDAQVALLQTFADQAVIAVENVRLFKELEARNRDLSETLDRQSATADVLRIIAQSPTELQPVLNAIAASAVRLCAASDAVIERLEGDRFYNAAHAGAQMKGLVGLPLPLTRGFPGGRAVLDRRRVIIDDVHLVAEREYPDSLELLRLNTIHSVAEIPLLSEGKPLGSLAVLRAEVRPFTDAEVALLETFASQAVIAIENVRLFTELQEKNREVEQKSHELEAASRHKSEFLANMSHELRTPLNAVIGFSEVLTERMFGELNEKQDEYVKDIYASGTHLLSLINDILDLSKIEAGRMELELAGFHLPQAIEDALVLVRERALRRGITLEQSIDARLGEIQGDERKVKQVLLNLLSNAIKFTPEGGKIEIRAVLDDTVVQASVSDTGVGIAPEDQEAIFEEFRQVGTAAKKVEGTGLGLALSRKFIELHGGGIWVKSQVGVGSTFAFTLPVRRGA